MGVSIHYSAIPPTSIFYQRLQTERPFATLLAIIFPYGSGFFRFFEIEPDEVDEILDCEIQELQDVFGTEVEAKVWIDEFRDELRRTRQAYPGIENRRAMLEKSAQKIEERLVQELTKTQVKDVTRIIGKLIFGGEDFLPDLLPSGEWLGLVPTSLIREGAEMLRGINVNELFAEEEVQGEWYRSQFEWWRNLYLATAERNEVVLVTVA